MMEPPEGVRLTLVVDTPIAVYSGMVPGFIAGQYQAADLEIDVVPLARRAGGEVILAAATGVDAQNRQILFRDRPPLAYDLASFDIGSTVIGLDLPGIREYAIPTRPISLLVRRIDDVLARAKAQRGPVRVVVVGGGAGGVELAFTLEHRLRVEGATPQVALVNAGKSLLRGFPPGLAVRAERRAKARGITIRHGVRVSEASRDSVRLDNGEQLASDVLIWVAGAASHGILGASGLPTDDRGYVSIRRTLQVEGYDDLFAVGDCATLSAHPGTPKAGVYAVRQGPFLADNLLAAAAGSALRDYRPQSDFLTLLNLGDGAALGAKWGRSFEGRWVMKLKDRIDRQFMERFQLLDAAGAVQPAFTDMPPMAGASAMLCGGCAAKLGQEPLGRALARLDMREDPEQVVLGLAAGEDVVAHTTAGGDTIVSTVDVFRSFAGDPYLVAQVAAVNAVSDLLAKGARPRYAQAIVAVPDALDDGGREEFLFQTLAGARAVLDSLEVTLLGGHTTTAPEALVGFHVEGTARPGELLLKSGARPGDALVLSKPLGTGVVLHADAHGRASGRWLEAAYASMLTSNAAAAAAALELGATAATDVTGFGLAGHLAELLRASGCSGRVALSQLPVLPGALELLAAGERSTFHPENRRGMAALAVEPAASSDPRLELLFDPQTSGGLLIALAAERVGPLLERLRSATDLEAAQIGTVEPADGPQAFTVGT